MKEKHMKLKNQTLLVIKTHKCSITKHDLLNGIIKIFQQQLMAHIKPTNFTFLMEMF